MENDCDQDTAAGVVMQPSVENRKHDCLQKILVNRNRSLGGSLDKEQRQVSKHVAATKSKKIEM